MSDIDQGTLEVVTKALIACGADPGIAEAFMASIEESDYIIMSHEAYLNATDPRMYEER